MRYMKKRIRRLDKPLKKRPIGNAWLMPLVMVCGRKNYGWSGTFSVICQKKILNILGNQSIATSKLPFYANTIQVKWTDSTTNIYNTTFYISYVAH